MGNINIKSHCYICRKGITTTFYQEKRKTAFKIYLEKLSSNRFNFGENISVCKNCLAAISKTVEIKGQVGNLEKQIEDLEKHQFKKLEELQCCSKKLEKQLNKIIDLGGNGSDSGREENQIKSDFQNILEEETKDVGKVEEKVWMKRETLKNWFRMRSSIFNQVDQDTFQIGNLNDSLIEEGIAAEMLDFGPQTEPLDLVVDRKISIAAFIPDSQTTQNENYAAYLNYLRPRLASQAPNIDIVGAENLNVLDNLGPTQIFCSAGHTNPKGNNENEIFLRQNSEINNGPSMFASNQQNTVETKLQIKFKCSYLYCSATFTRKGNKEIHERIHTGERPFPCRFCDKAFRTKNILTVHERIHSGEKPYACKWCNQHFSQLHSQKEHERIHTKPYPCKWCRKQFSRAHHLKLHERIHTGEKPYICQFCNKCFAQGGGLKSHERRHRREKRFACQICDRQFTTAAEVKIHGKVYHKKYLF